MFLIQMAGFLGSGKSTLAKEIGKFVDVIIVDSSMPISSYIKEVIEYINS